MHGSILVVEDDPDTATLLRDALRRRGWEVDSVDSGPEALDHLHKTPVDVVVTDIAMPMMSGIELCEQLHALHPEVLPIVITGAGNLDVAISAIRAGAFDFILKPAKTDLVDIAVSRAMQQLVLKRQLKALRTQALEASSMEGITGTSPAIQQTIEMIRRVADSDASVLISGESGTGKELVAKALHNLSRHRGEPFVAVNCAAMPAPLLESELFGHVRGAFTDARSSRQGLFVQAGSGTIFLDEMPIEMQVKLLRVLQERKVRPVGSDEELPMHARVITATNRDLELEIREKRFREDLFYRINVVAIRVPPLRERPTDIVVLAQQFVTRAAARSKKAVKGVSSHAASLLMAYDWPGNVRELENCIERAVALCRLEEITVDDLPAKIIRQHRSKLVVCPELEGEMITLHEMERRYVRQVLAAFAGNKTRASAALGIDRRSMYRRLEHDASLADGGPSTDRMPAGPAGDAEIVTS